MEKSVETSKFIADVNDINVEAIALIKTINLYVKNNQIKLNQEIYLMEKWKYENFEKYIKNIFKVISTDFYEYKTGKNKISYIFNVNINFSCSDQIKKWAGFNKETNTIEMHFPNVYSTINQFYIFLNIIDEITINNKKEQLLQIIKPEGDYFEFIIKSFERPEYHLINKTFINSIQVLILDQNKNQINFDEPPCLKLHIIESK